MLDLASRCSGFCDDRQFARDSQQLDAEAVANKGPDTPGRDQHCDHGNAAEGDQVPTPERANTLVSNSRIP
jgi:hypothetical protein